MARFWLFLLTGAAVLAAPLGARAQDDASPFLPAAGAPGSVGSAGGPAATYELAGASISSSGTQVCIYDVQAKHSHWIGVGETSDQIQVVRYDSVKDQAVIRAGGSELTLALRKPAPMPTNAALIPINAAPRPAAVFTPPLPSSPKAREIAKQERDARMLVSDLLEIGMRQRQAYEEAARKAAAEAAAKKQGGTP